MIFNLGKSKSSAVPNMPSDLEAGNQAPSLEDRVIERWRKLASGGSIEMGTGSGEGADLGVDTVVSADEESVLEEGAPRTASPAVSHGGLGAYRGLEGSVTKSEASVVRDLIARDLSSAGDKDSVSGTPPGSLAQSKKTPTADWSLSIEEDIRRRFGADIRSALGAGTVIEGKFSFDTPVRIDGTISGEVFSSSVLIVGEDALINASVRVGSIIILGRVNADIVAEDLVEVRSNGTLEGNVTTERFVIEEGGYFHGGCNIRRQS